MVLPGKTLGIKRLKLVEVDALSSEIRTLLLPNENGSSAFRVVDEDEIGEGFLGRNGKWKESGGRQMGGIHSLFVSGVQADMPAVAAAVSTVQVTYAMLEREERAQAAKARRKGPQPEGLDGQETEEVRVAEKISYQGRLRYGLPTTDREKVKVLILQDTVLTLECVSDLAAALSAREPVEYEGCRCTLRSLYMGNNILRAAGAQALSESLGRNSELRSLHVVSNGIGDVGCAALLSGNVGRTSLTRLSLADNRIGDAGVEGLPLLAEQCPYLKELHLNGNVIGDAGARRIAHSLVLTPSLQVLNLNGNRIRDEGVGFLAKALNGRVTSTALKEIFGSTPLQWKGVTAQPIPNTSLTSLHLASNWLRDGCLMSLGPALENNKSLRILELANNRIGDLGGAALATALSSPHGVGRGVPRRIALSCNVLSVAGLRSLEEGLRKHANVHQISVEGLSGGTIERRAAVQGQCAPKGDLKSLQQSRLESVVPQPPRKKPPPAQRFAGRVITAPQAGMGELMELRAEVEGTSVHLVAGLGMLLGVNLDEDPYFRDLCTRLGVTVSDNQRSRLEKLSDQQIHQRARIYDKLVGMEQVNPRPFLNAAKRIQSLFRMVKSKVNVSAMKYQLYLQEQRQQNISYVTHEMAETKQEIIERLAKALSQPTANRFWSLWTDHVRKCKLHKYDTVEAYSDICTHLGAAPYGLKILKKTMHDRFSDVLELKGLGMTPIAARALFLAMRGLGPCTLCAGMGHLVPGSFRESESPEKRRRSIREIFDEMDMDGSGYIEARELKLALQRMGLDLGTEDALNVLHTLDTDGSGRIDKEEFMTLGTSSPDGSVICLLCHGSGHTNERVLIGPALRVGMPMSVAREFIGAETIAKLVLDGNVLRAAGTEDLVTMIIESKSKIKILGIAHNELGIKGARCLGKLFLETDVELTECNAAGNMFGDEGTVILAEAILESAFMTVLNLSNNEIGKVGADALGAMLRENRTIRDLNLSWNKIRGDGAQALCDGFGQSLSLIDLNLSWNGFGELSACRALSEGLRWSAHLKTLDLSQNRIGFEGACLIAQGLEDNACLMELNMNGNPVTPQGARILVNAANLDKRESDILRKVRLEHLNVGVTDMSNFNPAEPAGFYSLGVENEYSRRVLRNVLRRVADGRAEFDRSRDVVLIEEVDSLKPDGSVKVHERTGLPLKKSVRTKGYRLPFMSYEEFREQAEVSEDVLKWDLPSAGIVEFYLVDRKTVPTQHDVLTSKQVDSIVRTMTNQDRTVAEKMQHLAHRLHVGDKFVSLKDLASLVRSVPDAELETRAQLLVLCINRVLEPVKQADLLELLSSKEQLLALELLQQTNCVFHAQSEGKAAADRLVFTRDNPTGHYELDLTRTEHRAIAEALVEIRSGHYLLEVKLQNHLAGRKGGMRDSLNRSMRNATLDGKPQPLCGTKDWKVPSEGLLVFDFVQVTKRPYGTVPVSDKEWTVFMHPLVREEEEPPSVETVRALRMLSDKKYFCCAQIAELLFCFKLAPRAHFQARVEVLVIAFARLTDWRGFPHLVSLLHPQERELLLHRLGHENVFDEALAVSHYSLDLSDPSQRFVAQELIHLHSTESGSSWVDVMLDGCDFERPHTWLTSVPRKGNLTLYYTREAAAIERVMEQGSYAFHSQHPLYDESSASDYLPKWLQPLCRDGQDQPWGAGWVRQHRGRMVKAMIEEKMMGCREAFAALDADGGGTISVGELTLGLFRIGIWLNRLEAEALVSCMDTNRSGEIDEKEFAKYWETWSFFEPEARPRTGGDKK